MLDDDRYQFAWDTITRMRTWVDENGLVTKPMIQALENIAVSVEERDGGRGGSRRYEGFRRW